MYERLLYIQYKNAGIRYSHNTEEKVHELFRLKIGMMSFHN